MFEGKPLIVVVGASDTGRTPMAAGLLRAAFGEAAVVHTAGVLSHAGEPAMPEAQMALEQLGIDLHSHTSQPLRDAELQQAELILAVDRGTELVLHTQLPHNQKIATLSTLANAVDVLDPHRMPLGVWIAAAQQLRTQIQQALPAIQQRLGIAAQIPPVPVPVTVDPVGIMVGEKLTWNEADLDRLMGLINEPAAPIDTPDQTDIAANEATLPDQIDSIADAVEASDPTAIPSTTADPLSRADQIARMRYFVAVAVDAPEIVDWLKWQQAIITQLRALAQQPHDPQDLLPAAVLMIEGKLGQWSALPTAARLATLQDAIDHLAPAVDAGALAAIGGALARC